jgi:GNAT superfamily N-acetyltransferase
MTVTVRSAVAADLPTLPAIELSGDAMFAELGIVFPAGPATVEAAIVQGADILVAGEPPAGFATVIGLDDHLHLEQISVRADQGGKGIGTLLLTEVARRAGPGLTLITFRDVPWNGPWYQRNGFAELPERAWGPQLRAHWQAEIDAGLHDLGPRFVLCFPGD